MEVKGKIIKKLPLVTGTAKATGNPWKKQDYVLETSETYPKTIAFDFFGDKADQYNFEVGDEIVLSFDIESREYNNRWYTSIRGWKAEKADDAAATQAPAAPSPAAQPAAPMPDFTQPDSNSSSDDLPF